MIKKLMLGILVIIGVIFLPTTIFLAFGMMPTIAVYALDKTVGKSKTICVGAMNFAGCFTYLLRFWTEFGQQTVENAFRLAADSQTIIVIYLLAAGGYAIDYAVTGITASIIVQRSEARLKKVRKEQDNLVARWGEEVTGRYALDDYGFPAKPIPPKNDKKSTEADTPATPTSE